jgi:hypothetical protein
MGGEPLDDLLHQCGDVTVGLRGPDPPRDQSAKRAGRRPRGWIAVDARPSVSCLLQGKRTASWVDRSLALRKSGLAGLRRAEYSRPTLTLIRRSDP